MARTLYGQQDSAAQKIQYGAVPAAVDTAGSEESLQLLDEVVIRKRFAVRMDKDTTFFAADSFTARKFDNLEELMRRIPGIRVAQDGSILYNGIPVKQVGIDGAPLVQMNPQKLLQLLRGRDVEELKIYTLETAVNQPGRFNERQEKGLDIRLKEAARHGYYGKLAAGTGSGAVAQWDQAADLSSFTADRKISAFIQSANTADQSAFAASELKGQAPGSLPRGRAANYTGGIYYDQKIGKKLSVGGYYSISRNTQHLQQQTKERSFLPSGQINTDAQSASESRMLTNTVSLQAAYSPDSVSQISLMLSAGTSSSGGAQQAYTSASNEAALPLSASRLSSSTTTQNPNAAGTLSCSRSFGSAGSLSSSFAANLSHSTARAEHSADIALLNSATAQQVRQQQ
ncbi:MAG: hypothetical protein JNL13_04625, partial [Chitinophagaceae bacterium]|nr:hypothetical protein [Chitinophagaceae bacterium]